MNQSKNDIDYSSFGGTKVEETPVEKEESPEQKVDYSQFGGESVKPEKEKAGKFMSALYGLYEGVLGIPGLVQYGANELSKGLEKAAGEEIPEMSFEQENPILAHLATLPESEGQAARRFRVAGNALPLAALGGIPGVVAGLVGSQAGQTVREIYGKEGKFENFGWGEGTAIGVDVLTGGATGIGAAAARKGAQAVAQEAPSIFRNAQTGLQRSVTKNAIQSEKNALDQVISNFSQNQIRGFEEAAENLSPNRFTQLTQSNASAIKRDADQMFRNTQLSIISPIEATTEEAGRAIQDAANITFRTEVTGAERAAYTEATKSAEGLSGKAPKTVEAAKKLRDDLVRNAPTDEQRPVIAFLNGLIDDLETTTPAAAARTSSVLDSSGNPIVTEAAREASSEATTRSANDLIDLVQRSNKAVNYESELREQSHRLMPIVSMLRQETGEVLFKKPEAARLFGEANLLHARNAEIWGTKYMNNVRFSENPEMIISSSKRASNMRNLKQGIQDPTIQAIAERAVVNQITEKGGSDSNRIAVNNLAPELSPNARGAAEALIDVKDPLATTGGRAAVRNDILKDAAQAVNTGKRPEKILDLMQTPKGYQIVRETLNTTHESRELLRSFERLFMEDILSSVTDSTGKIDFSKARQIFKNPEIRDVVRQIGGDELLRRFEQLERFSNNLQANIKLYSKPETQSLVKNIADKIKNAGLISGLVHMLGMPWPVIAGLGLATGGAKIAKMTYNTLQRKVLSNPRAVHYLEKVSQAKTTQELAKQLPRLMAELDKPED